MSLTQLSMIEREGKPPDDWEEVAPIESKDWGAVQAEANRRRRVWREARGE